MFEFVHYDASFVCKNMSLKLLQVGGGRRAGRQARRQLQDGNSALLTWRTAAVLAALRVLFRQRCLWLCYTWRLSACQTLQVGLCEQQHHARPEQACCFAVIQCLSLPLLPLLLLAFMSS